ncbi:BMP family ABC transporter substrate-binding protein [Defluviitoga tunisiensis]|uniref:Putative ABC-type transport system, periplasmic component/surface lipoprotein n=1 Tax=Defluviitoga tunisiensis TaxID=1006576 RepID=A0A0C7P065_DEFTU|nr:BMP family ABC transporter substrate-binding protein [Defluviitoga tunisiensis]CEP77640.1 putative ABC-type transport system, periplasmic component/surface lipoprotein [Defluviitoga tunisiensis]HHV00664.1 BMP family ABC transporter substrate-binding protein [Defluviitoga tunisiensis]HPT77390.1 BMP family ABC transporter substrate-binding protein [Defluviitaleaceae bacterium]
MKKRILKVATLLMLVFLLSITASAKLRIALLLNGNLGDMSFFDSAAAGMKTIEKELGATIKIIEAGPDPSNWEPALADLSEMGWDLIIVGTPTMAEFVENIAPLYPKQKYIFFDGSVDYSKGGLDNVYSIQYKQNEGSFLAGALAAMVTSSNLSFANPEKYIGFLGGMDYPIINDFLIGYIQGAKYIDPDIKVSISYVGNFVDAAKGKELSLAQYNQGVDVSFNVAGGAGLGQIEAAYEVKKYVIGVDSDQALLFEKHSPEKTEHILTSMLKRVDNSLVHAVKRYVEGTLEFGKMEALGLKEGAVGLADNKYYRQIVPEEMRKKIEELSDKIVNDEIIVNTAFGMSQEELEQIRSSVRK